MKSKSFGKTKSLLMVCCAAAALAFLMGVVDDSHARGGFDRGGVASSGGFSYGAAGPAGAGRVGEGGQAGVVGGPAGVGRFGVGGQAGIGGGPAGPARVGDVARDYRNYNDAAVANTVEILPCMADTITVDEVTYYTCGTTYYTQSFLSDGSVAYVQSEPPPGY